MDEIEVSSSPGRGTVGIEQLLHVGDDRFASMTATVSRYWS